MFPLPAHGETSNPFPALHSGALLDVQLIEHYSPPTTPLDFSKRGGPRTEEAAAPGVAACRRLQPVNKSLNIPLLRYPVNLVFQRRVHCLHTGLELGVWRSVATGLPRYPWLELEFLWIRRVYLPPPPVISNPP